MNIYQQSLPPQIYHPENHHENHQPLEFLSRKKYHSQLDSLDWRASLSSRSSWPCCASPPTEPTGPRAATASSWVITSWARLSWRGEAMGFQQGISMWFPALENVTLTGDMGKNHKNGHWTKKHNGFHWIYSWLCSWVTKLGAAQLQFHNGLWYVWYSLG